MTQRFGASPLILVYILAVLWSTVLADNVTYFDMVVNMTNYTNTDTTVFVDVLASTIHVQPETILLVDSSPVSLDEASSFEAMCITLLPNSSSAVGNESSWTFLRLNVSFVGSDADVTASSRALESISYLSACSIGILSMNATNISSTPSDFVSLRVTLSAGVTPQMFVSNLAALMKVPLSIFIIGDTNATSNAFAALHRSFTAAAGETFNLTIVGANTAVLQSRILNLSVTQLQSLGATELTPIVTPTPPLTTTAAPHSGGGDDDDDTNLIIILCCSIGGGLLVIIATAVVCVRCRDAEPPKPDYQSVEENRLVRPEGRGSGFQEMQQQELTRGHDDPFGNPYSSSHSSKPETPIRMVNRPPRIAINHANVNLL
jgi:hypothetical protein